MTRFFRSGAGAVLVPLLFSCATAKPGTPQIQIDPLRYDGQNIGFRLLIGAKGGSLRASASDFGIEWVKSCAGAPLEFTPVRPAAGEPVTLWRGQWFGREFDYRLFEAAGPDCIDVGISFGAQAKAFEIARFEQD